MSTPPDGALRCLYVLLDTSGSTVRGGFIAACEQVLPRLVDAAGRHRGVLLSVLTYGTKAQPLIAMSDPADIHFIPALRPAGLSSLAAGLWLLADSVSQDTSQLTADGLACLPPGALVVADGLPTDPAARLLEARDALDAAMAGTPSSAAAAPVLVYAAPPDEGGRLAIAGLRLTFHELAPGTPGELATSVLGAFERVLNG